MVRVRAAVAELEGRQKRPRNRAGPPSHQKCNLACPTVNWTSMKCKTSHAYSTANVYPAGDERSESESDIGNLLSAVSRPIAADA